MILKAYKYRIYPTDEQKVSLAQHFGSCRWLYNYALNKKKTAYEKDKTKISRFDLQAELPVLKKTEETKWLSEINSQSLQAVLLHLDRAYKTFFKNKKGYPKFKKKQNRQSFCCPSNTRKIDWEKSLLTIPLIKNIPIVLTRKFSGKIKTVTVSKTPTDKYFVSVLVETICELPVKKQITPETTIGIDLGVSDYVSFNNGDKIIKPSHLRQDLERLKILQRRASRKKNGSKNRIKANYRVAVLHEIITNKRLDFLHKVSSQIVNESQVNTICMESLRVSNMVKNHNFAMSISDAGWGKFVEFLKYKSEWCGKNIIEVGTFYPSSKTCSNCKHINRELKLSELTWICEVCNSTHDRNTNASKNIKFEGLRISGEALSVEPMESSALAGAMK
jgi:putative transposase